MAGDADPVGTIGPDDLPHISRHEDVSVTTAVRTNREAFDIAQRRRNEGIHSVAGVVVDEYDRVLLVRNEWADGWTLPGGLVRHGEPFDAAARREIREETGVDAELIAVRHVTHTEIVRDGEDVCIETYFTVFGGRAFELDPGDPADLGDHDEEIIAVDWFGDLPDEVYNPDFLETIGDW